MCSGGRGEHTCAFSDEGTKGRRGEVKRGRSVGRARLGTRAGRGTSETWTPSLRVRVCYGLRSV